MIERNREHKSQLETKLKKNKKLYSSVVKAIAEGLIVQDEACNILACNENAERILGLSQDQIMGRTTIDARWKTVYEDGTVFPKDDYPVVRTLSTGEPQRDVVMGVYQPNGLLSWISINCEPLWNNDKTQIEGVVSTFTDITARKSVQEQTYLLQVLALEVGRAKDFESGLASVLKIASEAKGFIYAEAWIPCPEEEILKCGPVWHHEIIEDTPIHQATRLQQFRQVGENTTFAKGAGLPGRVWNSKQAEWQSDVSQLPQSLFPRSAAAKKAGLKTALGIPLLVDSEILAVLVLFKFESNINDALLVESLVEISAQLSLILRTKRVGDQLRDNEQRLRLALEGSGDGLWNWNIATHEVFFSPQWIEMLGYTPADLPPELDTWERLIHPEDAIWVQNRLQSHLNDISISYRFEYRLLAKTGEWRWIANYGKVVEWDEVGHPLRMAGVHRDIHHRKQMELNLQNSEAELRALFDAMHDLVLVRDFEGRCLGILSSRTEHLVEPVDKMLNRTLHETIPQEQADLILDCIRQCLSAHKTISCEYSLQIQDKEEWYLTNISPLSVDTVILVVRNISKRKKLEQQLYREKELAQVTLYSIGDAVITTDAGGRIQYFNPVAEALTGWKPQNAIGLPLEEIFNIVHETTRERVINPVEVAIRENRIVSLANHTLLVCQNGQEVPIEDSAAPIRDFDGNLIGAVLVFHDVSNTRSLTHQLSWQAKHDSLTKLVNRREFEHQVEAALTLAQTQDRSHTLCYLDLDQFKIVNDSCGHGAGDELLSQIANLLMTKIRKTDTLARLGGDEFGALLYHCPLSQASQIAKEMRECVQSYRFAWKEQIFKISVSIGLVKIDATSESLGAIMSSADAACYAAKNRGRNRIHVFRKDDQELIKQRGEMQWATRITRALEEDSFCLYYQTIVAVNPAAKSEGGEHYEVLLRLRDENENLILPMAFIPAAERYGLMHLVDRWVIRTLFAAQGEHYRDVWRAVQLEGNSCGFLVAINLSGASINDDLFIDFLHEQFSLHQIPPQLICFEITETVAISNLRQATQFIERLQSLGCYFALDDFGSGMSSFAYLRNLPVNFLKIDGEFIRNIGDDKVNNAMVEAMTQIGHVMGIKIIAEFVENKKIFECLAALGVDYAQGFGISKPLPLI